MDLAVFGGTFNPPHRGHLELARHVRNKLSLSEILFIPAFQSHLKDPASGASPEDRLQMVRLASREAGFAVSDIELDRRGVSYTYDTMVALGASESSPLGMIVGDDHLANLHRWYRYEDLIQIVKFIVVRRTPGIDPELPEGAVWVDDFLVDVSSTDVRNRIRTRGDWESLVPRAVAEYIKDHGLYDCRS